MKEILRNKKVIIVSLASLIVVFILLITLKDSYAYYGGSNELEIMKATIGKLKPTIEKVYIEEENKQYTNNPNPSVTIEWTDDNITEYCVTTESTCDVFTQLSELNSKSVTVPITLNGEGNHILYAYIKNKYGYTSLVSSDTITLDTTPPTISSLSTTEIKETSATIKVTANSGDVSGIKQYCYSTTGSGYKCENMVNEEITFTISNLKDGTDYTLSVYLIDNAGNEGKSSPTTHKFTTISAGKPAKEAILANSPKSLESEDDFNARNAEITGNVKDDLRRFVGTYETVTDNFICFGTDDQETCKRNMDTYMYRIIGIDTQNRLKLIKATKVKKGSQSTFMWHNTYSSDTTWENSDLYKGLNGQSPKSGDTSTCNQCFGNGSEYSYMSQDQWTSLISPVTYYIGNSTATTNPQLFQNEIKEHFDSGKISLMYLSDYLYANNGNANTNNWLFIANGLNGNHSSLGNGATAPTAEYEWTMTRYGYGGGSYHARDVASFGAVSSDRLYNLLALRPVFYLIPAARITGGNGQIETPYMIAPWSG